MIRLKRPVVEPLQVLRVSFYGEISADCPADPKSSARYDLAVVVSRPVSIFLRVLTGFFISVSADYSGNLELSADLTALLGILEAVHRPHAPR